MTQVLDIADRVEVLRLGQRVAQLPAAGTTDEDLVLAMTSDPKTNGAARPSEDNEGRS